MTSLPHQENKMPRIIVGITVSGTETEDDNAESSEELFDRVRHYLKPLEADDVTLLEEDA